MAENTMTIKDLAATVAKRQGTTEEQAEAVIADVLDAIKYALSQGFEVKLQKFGNFYVNEPKEEEKFSPMLNRMVKTKRSPRFKVGQAFKDAVNPDNP